MRRPWILAPLWLALFGSPAAVVAHDIPNARVDRTIQVTLSPGRLDVDYEVELAELTLTRDLRDLIGALPDGDREVWFQRYGQELGPLNGKGLLLTLDDRPLLVRPRGFDLAVEEHPRYTFHYEAELPDHGRLKIHDSNFVSSEGTSRLAVRGRVGVVVQGDSLPTDVHLITPQPLWLLSDEDERRTKQAAVEFRSTGSSTADRPVQTAATTAVRPPAPPAMISRGSSPAISTKSGPASDRLTRLIDRRAGVSLVGLILIAFGLGAIHSIQPGHGKTLVAATVAGERGSWVRGVLLALITTATHTGSVLLVALGLWWTRSTRYEYVHSALTFTAGFLIAAIGLWRLGRRLGGYAEHRHLGDEADDSAVRPRNLIGLGVAGGLVPCWDAVALILVGEAVGRLGTAIVLLVAFGWGMALVLVAVGGIAARCRRLAAPRNDRSGRAEQWLAIAANLVLCVLGIYLLGLA